MELADEGGIESLTMRELGRRLGVEAASLYNPGKGQDGLLDGMADLAAGVVGGPSDVVDGNGPRGRGARAGSGGLPGSGGGAARRAV